VQDGTLVASKYVAGPETFSSLGGELLSDFYLFRIPYRISGGVRAAWKEFGKIPSFEIIFNMDINGTKIGKNPRL